MSPVRIAIESDDRLVSDGIVQILRSESSFVVAVSSERTSRGRDIDVRIIDVRQDSALPSDLTFDGGERPYVIVVNAPDEDAWAADALSMRVRGILSHASGAGDLVKAIHIVHDGGIWARRRWLNAYVQRETNHSRARRSPPGGPGPDARLSKREREVFRVAATGACNKELADRLAISEATVKAHLTRIFQKLGVSGRAELAAAYHGLRLPVSADVVRRSA